MNRNLRKFQTKAGEEHQFGAMNVNLSSDPLLQLLQEEIFEILTAGKGGQNHQHEDADQHNGAQNNDTAISNQRLLPTIRYTGG